LTKACEKHNERPSRIFGNVVWGKRVFMVELNLAVYIFLKCKETMRYTLYEKDIIVRITTRGML
jgi:hypothetical protein